MKTHLMKNLLRTLLGLSTLATVAAAHAGSTPPTTMQVSAEVPFTCMVSTTPLNFSTLSATADTYKTTTITVNCPTNVGYNIALDAGQNQGTYGRQVTNGSGAFIFYELRQVAAQGPIWGDSGFGGTFPDGAPRSATGNGTDQVHTVSGHAPAYGNSPPGVYNDTVMVTVHF